MTDSALLRVHAVEKASAANGPGLRTVIWTQGCSLACPGCFNPQTHPAAAGFLLDTHLWVNELRANSEDIEGVTVSGGEPFQQPDALFALLRSIRRQTSLSILLFSGYTQNELRTIPRSTEILACADVLMAGRYRSSLRSASGLIGSTNKSIVFLTNRYAMTDFSAVPEAEVWIGSDGQVQLSGIDPITW